MFCFLFLDLKFNLGKELPDGEAGEACHILPRTNFDPYFDGVVVTVDRGSERLAMARMALWIEEVAVDDDVMESLFDIFRGRLGRIKSSGSEGVNFAGALSVHQV